MPEDLTKIDEELDVEIPFADDEEAQREISGILWGIFILTFCTQVLTALMFLLTNPAATWQAALVMVIMAAQGTLFGGAIKMLTKKLEFIQNKLDKEKTTNIKIGLESENKKTALDTAQQEIKRLNKNLDDSHAELIAVKKAALLKDELYDLKKG